MSAVADIGVRPISHFYRIKPTLKNPSSLILLALFAASALLTGCGSSTQGSPAMRTSIAGTTHPLVAQVTVQSWCAGQAMVEFGLDTNYGRTTSWSQIAGGGQMSTILVAGMRASTTYHMRVQRQCSQGNSNTDDMTFTTGPLPSTPIPAVQVSRPATPIPGATESGGIELIDTIPVNATANNIGPFVTDRDGNPIWYYDVGPNNYANPFKLLPNGHMIFVLGFGSIFGTASALREIDLAGNTIREMDISTLGQKMQAAGYNFVPTLYHHEILPLDNGHVIALTNFTEQVSGLTGYSGPTAVLGDGVIDLDENWNPVWAWNSFDHLDPNRHLSGLPDWTHSNALVYLPNDGNLLISMRHQSWILKLDYSNGTGTGNVLWTLGYQGSFAMTQNGAPTSDPTLWFSFQHFPSLISQSGSKTTFAVWDNGDFRPLDTSGTTCLLPGPPLCYSRATVFQVDESSMVADLNWEYAPGDFSIWGGSINQLANGNVEFDLNDPQSATGIGTASQIQEVTQTGTPQVVWQMTIPLPQFAYRAYRVPSLYPGVTWP